MRVCIQVLYTSDWTDISKITVPNVVNYCRKHGYMWNVQAVSKPYSGYDKISYAKEIFEKDYADVVWCLDCDALITNYNYRLEHFIDNEHSVFICRDYNGVNAGSFIVRKSDFTNTFFDYLLCCKGEPDMHCEQDAIVKHMKEFPANNQIKILPHPSINSYLYENYPEIPLQSHENGQWESGDFLLHLPGMSNEKRIEILKNTPVIL